MYQFSDSDSVDSDEGIRFKTDSTRNKEINRKLKHDRRKRSRSRSPRHKTRHSHRDTRLKKDTTYKSRSKKHYRSRSPDEEFRKKYKKTTTDAVSTSNLTKQSVESDKTNENKVDKIALGPSLPPHLMKNQVNNSDTNESDSKVNLSNVPSNTSNLSTEQEPQLQSEITNSQIGPILPENLKKIHTTTNTLGPALPPHLKNKTLPEETTEINSSPVHKEVNSEESPEDSTLIVGPTLPPHLRKQLAENITESEDNISEELEQSEDCYGPLPVGDTQYNSAQIALEERALQLKMNQLEPNSKSEPAREEWMLELPSARAKNLGIGPRQFRSKAGPDMSDRSSWTDTPEDKANKKKGIVTIKKADLRKEAELNEIEKRDRKQDAIVKKHKKKNKDSLLEIHQAKLKQKKEEQGPSERKPFNRETDLQVNRFDEAQKKAVLKKAQLLDDRFSRGQSKFL